MPHAALAVTAGLFTRADDDPAPIALAGVSVDAEISGLCARVSIAHRYVNREATPIEAVYVFPLDEGAAVCGFEAVIDGVVVKGEVLERDKAFERYDDAILRGDGAFLLDEERPDVFQASIGNLAPGAEVLVRLTYVSELTVDDGQARFTLPATLTPRYAPEQDQRAVGRPDAETLNPPVAWSVPYGLDLTVRLTMPGGVRGLASPSHPVSVALADDAAIVRLSTAGAALDRDFVLTVDAAALREPQAWREDVGDDSAIAVAFAPRLEARRSAAEVIFVVDRSGSMDGDPIAEVRNALQICLRSLTHACTFNIVGFGSTFGPLFPRSRVYDQASLDEAARHVAGLQADLGGTELEPALRFALEGATDPERPRQVIVLTDGAVTNTDDVIALATAHRDRARVFTLGIGVAASQHLVRGIARAGRGLAEFIHPGERVEGKVVRLLERALSSAVDVRLEWIGGTVVPAPREVPPLFDGQRLLTYGLVATGGPQPTAVRLTACADEHTTSWEVTIPGPGSVGRAVTTLAARARIRELEESAGWTGARRSRQHARRLSSERREIVDLAIRHGLLSRETSYVAIEHRATPVTGDLRLRRVPIALPAGWGGGRSHLFAPPSASRGSYAVLESAVRFEHADAFATGDAVVQSAEATPLFSRMFGWRGRNAAASSDRPETLDALVALQAADGSWPLDTRFADALGRDLADLERTLSALLEADREGRRAWATALALAWLEQHAVAWRDEWTRLADKGHAWIVAHVGEGRREAAMWAAAQAVR